MSAHGTVHFNELNTWEPQKAMAFYGKTLGWTFDEMPGPDGTSYILAKSGEAVVAGIFTYTSPFFDGAQDFWLTYIAVDHIDRRCEAARAAGANVRRPPFDVPGFGRIAVLDDATGVTLAFIQSL